MGDAVASTGSALVGVAEVVARMMGGGAVKVGGGMNVGVAGSLRPQASALNARAALLSKELDDQNFAFYGTTLRGVEE